jgi:hypothetical protein
MYCYVFAGILFGVAVRTKKPLAVPLAPFVWKLLVGEPVSIDDLEETDSLYAQSLRGIRDIHQSGVTEATFHEVVNTVRLYVAFQMLRKDKTTGLVEFFFQWCHL